MGELEPYMDWFNDVKPKDLQARVANRTFEQWREEQPMRKESLKRGKDTVCHFPKLRRDYLANDVDCMWQLVITMGTDFWNSYKAIICHKNNSNTV